MGSRSSHVRTKVVALLVSLVALWSFAAFVTVREGMNLLGVSTLNKGVAEPSVELVPALQRERRLAAVYLSGPSEARRGEMLEQRRQTDVVAAVFRRLAEGGDIALAAGTALKARIAETLHELDRLADDRARIDAGRVKPASANALFTEIIDSLFRVYDVMAALDDQDLARDVRTLITLTRALEVVSQEDALLAGALAKGELTAEDHQRFVQLVGAQRFLYAEATAVLPDADRARYDQIVAGAIFTRFRALEDTVVQRRGPPPAVTLDQWTNAAEPAMVELRNLYVVGGDDVVARATPIAIGVVVRLALAGGLGLIAVIASIIVYITTARALVKQLGRLRNAANELASYRLPRVVERLQHGERVDVDHEAPPLDFGRDEIGQVGQAFNAVQSTAVRVAVEQAELRRSVRDVFLSLARRSQALLHRQLGLLDAMERRATDSEELAELFRVDHLATRMRRNAENLIVLSGATAGRAWRKPVPMIDVVRGALAEVEDYTRVTVLPVGSALLAGRAVGDVIHLLAELIENAVSFSPPQTIVRVGGSIVGNGFAVEIEDRGLGMSDEDRAVANAQLANPPEFRLSSTARLGLYVVGKLAERHGIRVRLTPSPYGGTTAVVLIPSTLIAEDSAHDVDFVDVGVAGGVRRASLAIAGRHRNEAAAPSTSSPDPSGSSPDRSAATFASRRGPHHDVTQHDVTQHDVTHHDVIEHAVSEDALPTPSEPRPRRSDPPILTPAGLPLRQRNPGPAGDQPPRPAPTSVAPPPVPATVPPTAAQIGRAGRGPEEIRNIMSSYRSGTLRGRTDAAHLAADTNHHAPEWTPSAQEPSGTDEGA
jgi:signal transduction histidine kinase